MSIWNEIQEERAYQKKRWGGDAHDDQHTTWDWIVFITQYVGRAVDPGDVDHFDIQTYRTYMIKIAALAVAAIEWCDRNFDVENIDAD